jgi:hypothetical protein
MSGITVETLLLHKTYFIIILYMQLTILRNPLILLVVLTNILQTKRQLTFYTWHTHTVSHP